MKKSLLSILIIFACFSTLFANSKYYSGSTGSNYIIAIPEARGVNLSNDQMYFKILLQTQLTDTIQKFSPIQVVDRQNEDIADTEIAKSEDGSYSDEEYIQFGKKLNAKFVAVAQLINMDDIYSLSVRIIETEKNAVKCTYSDNHVSARTIKNGMAINMAVKDILSQLGIVLTDAGLKAINGGVDENTLKAQENLSKGISASKRGTTVEALQYYYAASEYNLDNMEINARLNAIQSAVSSGNLGDQARGEDEAYDYWLKTLKEADEYFAKNPPYEIAYSKNLDRLERTSEELKNKENSIKFDIGLIASNNSKNTIKALMQGISNSPKVVRETVSIWPNYSLQTERENAWLNPQNCVVTVQLINDVDKVIGEKNVKLDLAGPKLMDTKVVTLKDLNDLNHITISNIKSTDITDNLTIKIKNVYWNNVQISTDNIRISTLEELKEPFEVALKAEQERRALEDKLRREKAEQEKIQKEREENIKQKKEAKEKRAAARKEKHALKVRNGFYVTLDSVTNFYTNESVIGGSFGYDWPLFGNLFWGFNTGFYKDVYSDDFALVGLGELGMAFGLTPNTELYFKGGIGGSAFDYPTLQEGLMYRGAVGFDWMCFEFEYSLDYSKDGLTADRITFGFVFNKSWFNNAFKE